MTPLTSSASRLTLHGIRLEVVERGPGRPLLWLHGEEGFDTEAPFLGRLAECGRVIAPTHPGFGHSPDADGIDTIDDLSYLYLDLLAEREARDAVVIGASLGGWIAASLAVKSTARLSRLVLVAPVGIKVGDRETRDIPDIWALGPDEVLRLTWADPTRAAVDYTTLPEERVTAIVRDREATALYGWEPYLHDPKLKGRLHRIDVPTLLLWGADDRFVTPEYYGAAYRALIPGARLETIAGVGHFPHLERPDAFVERVAAFVAT